MSRLPYDVDAVGEAVRAYGALYEVLVAAAGDPDRAGAEADVTAAAWTANAAFVAAGLVDLPDVVTGPAVRQVYPAFDLGS